MTSFSMNEQGNSRIRMHWTMSSGHGITKSMDQVFIPVEWVDHLRVLLDKLELRDKVVTLIITC